MSKIIYVPLEHIDSRYTSHLDRDIIQYFESENIDYIRIYPDVISPGLKPGMFLDSNFTTKFKSLQMAMISDLYQNNEITDNDIYFFSDLWFPGIEAIPYMNHFNKVYPKITGIIHAGSFTDTDEVRQMERWAKGFEEIIFDICDKIYLGSEFIKQDLLQKRFVQPSKLIVTGLPLDFNQMDLYKDTIEKENIVIFNGRNHPEKQPWLFEKTKHIFEDSGWKFIWTQELNLNKSEYYELLAKSKIVISFALQENFGYGIREAVYLGNLPILPNTVVYKEIFPKNLLYDNYDEFINILRNVMDNKINIIPNQTINNFSIFNTWFKRN